MRWTAALTLLLLAAGCGRPPGEEEVAEARGRAEDAAARLMGALFQELQQALASGPPEQAIDVCAGTAPVVAKRIGAETGLSVRRTSLQYRNEANAPDDYERAWLEKAAKSSAPPAESSEVVERPDGSYELRYMRPVQLAAMCTKCHGQPSEIPPAVGEAIARRYPGDRATGFRPGDLRGAISVRVPLE